MSRQAPSEAPRDYGCLSHAVGASTARQRGEVARDDNDHTGRLGYQDAAEAGPPLGGPRDDDSAVIVVTSTAACLKQSPVGAIGGLSGDAEAERTRGSTVQVCPVTPPQRHKPVRPAWKASLEMDPPSVRV